MLQQKILLIKPKTNHDDDHALTKSYVDYLSENDRNGRDLSTVAIDQVKEFDKKKLLILDSSIVKRNQL